MANYSVYSSFVSKDKYKIKCPNSMTPASITVHNTYNDASARAEAKYMISNNRAISFHAVVDNKEAIITIPSNKNAFHAGNKTANLTSYSVEICYSKSGGERFDKAEDNAAHFVAKKLNEFNLSPSDVYTHKHWSGKYCPHRTLDLGWDRFMQKVRSYYYSDNSSALSSVTHRVSKIDLNFYSTYKMTTTVRLRDKPTLNNSKIVGSCEINTIRNVYDIIEEHTPNGYYKWANTNGGYFCMNEKGSSYCNLVSDFQTRNITKPKKYNNRYMVTSNGLNVRKGPSTRFGIIKTYPKNQVFDVLEYKGNWGRTPSGWVSLSYAKKI